jgi:thiol-disulfide isomerase/thioredoxin
MKIIFTLFLVALSFSTIAQGYKITLQTPNYKTGLAYLTYHMGKNLNVEDSAEVNSKGVAVFAGTKTLIPGIYAIVFPGKSLSADFLVDKEQQIQIKADTADLNNMQVTGSPANNIFQDYKKFVAVKGAQLQKERTAYMQSRNKADSALHEANYLAFNRELNAYRDNIIKNQSASMMAALLTAMREPSVPGKTPLTHQDSLDNYNYYKAHYWDGITFMDERVLRTPFFLPKLERYYREVMPQAADSIIKDVDYKLLLARSAPEMYKYLLNWLTDEYLNPKYMGQDAIFVHLFEKYHSKGLTPWLNEKQMETITRRAYMQMSNLIGEKAANLELIDPAGKPAPLYNVKGDYTVVVFWDPTCGHCKEELPKIDSIYRASWKANNVKMYAVLTENHVPEWNAYIKEHSIADWTHVYQTKEMADAERAANKAGFRQLYDITQTPILYLLDKDKRIIGKKLTWLQLNDLLMVKSKSEKAKTGK